MPTTSAPPADFDEDEIDPMEVRLKSLIDHHGSFWDIPWGTMFGEKMTLRDMTDNHVENSINHHYGIRFVLLGRIGYLNRPDEDNDMPPTILQMNLDACYSDLANASFNEYLMREIKRRRNVEEWQRFQKSP